MKPKLLIMCSTRRRPHKLKIMLLSFFKTKSDFTRMVVYISEEDPKLEEYKKIIKRFKYNIEFIIGKERNYLVTVLNYLSTELYPNFKYYGEVNDDHIYRTKDWDKRLIKEIVDKGNGWGIACGDNSISEDWNIWQHPGAFIMSGNIVRTLGYFTYPLLRHFWSDEYHKHLGLGINRLFYVPEVIIEHMCWHATPHKAEEDDNTKEMYSNESKKYGIEMFNKWKKEQYESDINKLKTAMAKEGIK